MCLERSIKEYSEPDTTKRIGYKVFKEHANYVDNNIVTTLGSPFYNVITWSGNINIGQEYHNPHKVHITCLSWGSSPGVIGEYTSGYHVFATKRSAKQYGSGMLVSGCGVYKVEFTNTTAEGKQFCGVTSLGKVYIAQTIKVLEEV